MEDIQLIKAKIEFISYEEIYLLIVISKEGKKKMGRFQDKVMIVTGAARGIGKVVALKAAEEGAKLVLADVNEKVGKETLQKM